MQQSFGGLRVAILMAGLGWICALIALGSASDALARQGAEPRGMHRLASRLWMESMALRAIDAAEETAKAADSSGPGPLRYAVARDVAVSPNTHGEWETLSEGDRLWLYNIQVPGATDLNFGFAKYYLPPGATLHVYSDDASYHEGPYTSADNKPHGQLWVPPVPGDSAVIELFVPNEAEFEPTLVLSKANAGFRDLFRRPSKATAVGKQGPCNIDVICPEGDPWRNEIRSVARYSIDGLFLCTGQLVNDARGSSRPLFLSAAHCGVTRNNAATIVVFWNFEAPVCGDLIGGSLAQNQSGASLLASRADVDFALVELDDDPDPSFDVHFTGWDRTGLAPSGSVGIHHPGGDEKAISLNDDPPTTMRSCIADSPAGSHWRVDNWEQGTTESGSSGSGLWDPAANRLVGFLSGGTAACSNPAGFDCYGRFSVAWNGSGPRKRLRDHLDPAGEKPRTTDGLDPVVKTGSADLSISKADRRARIRAGQTLNYRIVVRNRGPDVARAIVVSDVLPRGLRFVEATTGQWQCDNREREVTCTFEGGGGQLAPGRRAATLIVRARVPGDFLEDGSKAITNFAEVESAMSDPDRSNNRASDQTTVTPRP